MKRVCSLRVRCSLRSLVQDSGAPAWLSTAARDSVSDCSLRSLRFALGSRLVCRRLRTEERVRSLLLTMAARETQRSQLGFHSAASRSGG
jgi:hypothetical protein